MPHNTRLASRLLIGTLSALGSAAHASDSGNARFTVEDLVLLKRITDPRVSPDGRQVAFVQRETDMDANKGRTSLWLLDLTPGTAQPRRLTDVKANDSSPRWSPDGRTLYFLSTRSGRSQGAKRSASPIIRWRWARSSCPRAETCSPFRWKCSRTAPRSPAPASA